MIETYVKLLATFYTGLLMAGIVSLLLFGGFEFEKPKIPGRAIQAQMIDISQIKRTQKKPKTQKKAPIKKPPPVKKDPPVQKQVQKKVQKKAPVITPPKPKTDPNKLAQQKKDLARKKKLEEIRKKRIAAEEKAKREEENLKNITDKIKQEETDELPTTTSNQNTSSEYSELQKLMALYQASVVSAVTRKWSKPPTATKNIVCHVKVRQIPGGGVVDAQISSPCNADSVVKKSILDAIRKAEPLPYKGFEKVFSRQATFIFKPED